MNNFLVYRSSAGSGKTYTLMRVYLSIVLKDPHRYRNILAITFTNKAANEIKQRILSSLKAISGLEAGRIPQKLEHLVISLMDDTGLQPEELKDRAGRVLTMILHNYGDFSVSTIDSFVHRIIRAFSFDLKLSMNFEVEMDTGMLLELAVEDMLAAAGTESNLTEILVNFIRERAEEDESWQIDRTLLEFSKNLFREDAVRLLPDSGSIDAAQVKHYAGAIRRVINEYQETLTAFGKQAMSLIAGHGLGADLFYQKSRGIYGFFDKLAKGNFDAEINSFVRKTIENNEWLSSEGKKSSEGASVTAISETLKSIFCQVEDKINKDEGRIILLKMVLRQLYPMSVLSELRSRIEKVKNERNVLPIAEFNRIVADIVMEEPVPFIYERIGERYRYFMIDEFQDTSVLQWMNLMPLIENSLSQDGLNMIVGDGKQAIYRFRNGDVDQFVRLPGVDNPQNSPVVAQRAEVLRREYKPAKLAGNFRSRCEIVEFNNRFFNHLAPLYLDENKSVYHEGEQEYDPNNRGGKVRIEFYDGDDQLYNDHTINRVFELIQSLCGEGYKPGDIAVLCRSNKESSGIAVFLNSRGIKVVSADSLLLKNSAEVNFLVNWLELLNDPGREINRIAIIEYLWDNHLLGMETRAEVFLDALGHQSFLSLLERSGRRFDVANFRDLSLFDKVEEIIRIFDLQERSPLYLQFFLDEVLGYSSTRSGGIPGFLEYWSAQRDKLSVVLPAGDDAVQVMTIHKSKGLEFPVVIFPFAGKSAGGRNKSVVWVPFSDAAIPELKSACLKLESRLEKTPYASLYTREEDKKRLDLLNLVYVAFTRPSERLYVLSGKLSDKPDKIGSVTDMLAGFLDYSGDLKAGELIYSFGDGARIGGRTADNTSPGLAAEFHTYPWAERLVFAARAPFHWNAGEPSSVQMAGNLLHYALSLVHDYRDKDDVIAKLVDNGMVDTASAEKIGALMERVFGHPQARHFFDGDGVVFAEAEILTPEGKSYRPDRVIIHRDRTDVVDFKSGRREEYHDSQVRNYASLLSDMGYPEPVAWLLYLNEDIDVIRIDR